MTPHIEPQRFRSRAEYTRAQRIWRDVFNYVLKPSNQRGWEDWLSDPFHDGNPIFSRVSHHRRKGVVINQITSADDSLVFKAWMDTFGSPEFGDEIEHLAISCMLTDYAIEAAKSLLKAYIIEQRSLPQMSELCLKLTHKSPSINA
jgi:hypothetical protein